MGLASDSELIHYTTLMPVPGPTNANVNQWKHRFQVTIGSGSGNFFCRPSGTLLLVTVSPELPRRAKLGQPAGLRHACSEAGVAAPASDIRLRLW